MFISPRREHALRPARLLSFEEPELETRKTDLYDRLSRMPAEVFQITWVVIKPLTHMNFASWGHCDDKLAAVTWSNFGEVIRINGRYRMIKCEECNRLEFCLGHVSRCV